jgi:hypothetical protein
MCNNKMITQKFYFLGLKPSRGLLTLVDRQQTPRYMCFRELVHAEGCKNFLNYYRKEHDNWPHLDFSVGDMRFLTPDKSDHDLVIHTFTEREMDFIAMYSSSAFIVIDTFMVENDRMNFDGDEMDPVLNKHMFVVQLETSLKIV